MIIKHDNADGKTAKEFYENNSGIKASANTASAVAVAKRRAKARKTGMKQLLKSMPTRMYTFFLKYCPELVHSPF